jgi:small subunit ribosomal protein S9
LAERKDHVAVGRRKEAVARIRLAPGTGKLVVNGRDAKAYFARETLVMHAVRGLALTEREGQYDVVARVAGGGKSGQAGAVRLGIARALVKAEPGLREALRGEQLLTRDPRVTERKKPGQPKARKRFQFSKR